MKSKNHILVPHIKELEIVEKDYPLSDPPLYSLIATFDNGGTMALLETESLDDAISMCIQVEASKDTWENPAFSKLPW